LASVGRIRRLSVTRRGSHDWETLPHTLQYSGDESL